VSEARTRYLAYASRLRVGCPENYDFPKLNRYPTMQQILKTWLSSKDTASINAVKDFRQLEFTL
jgi:hypothetical protein